MISLLLIPDEPNLAFAILVPVFMLDQMMNAGILIANNGFMIKNSPSENRTMYIAACQALAGLVGGTTSIIGGAMLAGMADWHWMFLGKTWGHFHVMFAASVLLRWVSAVLVRQLREPNSQSTRLIVDELLSGPIARFLASPAGAFLTIRRDDALSESVAAEIIETDGIPAFVEEPSPNVVPSPKHLERQRVRS